MTPVTFALVFALAGVLLLVAEVLLPSGGVLGIAGGVALVNPELEGVIGARLSRSNVGREPERRITRRLCTLPVRRFWRRRARRRTHRASAC